VIDFGDLIHAPLVCDLAVPICELTEAQANPDATAAAITAGYHSVTPLLDDELRLIFDLVATRCAMCIPLRDVHRGRALARRRSSGKRGVHYGWRNRDGRTPRTHARDRSRADAHGASFSLRRRDLRAAARKRRLPLQRRIARRQLSITSSAWSALSRLKGNGGRSLRTLP